MEFKILYLTPPPAPLFRPLRSVDNLCLSPRAPFWPLRVFQIIVMLFFVLFCQFQCFLMLAIFKAQYHDRATAYLPLFISTDPYILVYHEKLQGT